MYLDRIYYRGYMYLDRIVNTFEVGLVIPMKNI